MKAKILFSLLSFAIIASAFSQKETIELKFMAESNEQNVPLDSILIENLTQSKDTTLYAPDTILVLDYVSSIISNNAINENNLALSQNYPNPFEGKTEFDLQLYHKEWVQIKVQDILGRDRIQYENTLNRGDHSFTFYSGKDNYYVLSAITKNGRRTIKMINLDGNGRNNCEILYNRRKKLNGDFKETIVINDFIFKLGDQLRFTGYSTTINEVVGSDVIEDVPQSNKIYMFEIKEGIPCPGVPKVSDAEGNIYNTVLIGDQCWMKENLNVGTFLWSQDQMKDNGIIEKYCYDNDTTNCNIYGGLYQWKEIMQYFAVEGTQGICPDGWHIPTHDEWRMLEGFVDSHFTPDDTIWTAGGWRGWDAGKKLKSTTGWLNDGNGTDSYGFLAVPAGFGYNEWYYQDWVYKGSGAAWWSSTDPYPNNTMYYRHLRYNFDQIRLWALYKDNAFSVRCLRDE